MDNCELKSISFITTVKVINVNYYKNSIMTTLTASTPLRMEGGPIEIFRSSWNQPVDLKLYNLWREITDANAKALVRNLPDLSLDPLDHFFPWSDLNDNVYDISNTALFAGPQITAIDSLGNTIDNTEDLMRYDVRKTNIKLEYHRRMLGDVLTHAKRHREEYGIYPSKRIIVNDRPTIPITVYSTVDFTKTAKTPEARVPIMQRNLKAASDPQYGVDPDAAQRRFDLPWAA
jgi:hypothetical protein